MADVFTLARGNGGGLRRVPAESAGAPRTAPTGARRRKPAPDFRTLSRVDWDTLQALQDLDDAGTYPTGDDLVRLVSDFSEGAVRRSRKRLIEGGFYVIRTPDVRPWSLETKAPPPEPVPDDGEYVDDAPSEPLGPGRRGSATEWEFNVALYKIVHGDPGIYQALSVVTGLSPNACKCRVNAVVNAGPPDDAGPGEMDPDTSRYVAKMYGLARDPAASEWRAIEKPSVRRHPDRTRFRSSDTTRS